jgi:hypothetical protein
VKLKTKIFGLGFNKTGTSTLGRCFDILKLGPTARPQVLHDTFARESEAARSVAAFAQGVENFSSPKEIFGEFPYRAICDQIFDYGNTDIAVAIASRFRSFHDRPWNVGALYQVLDREFPESRFILNWRKSDNWWRSVERWLTVSHADDIAKYERYLKHTGSEGLDKDRFITAYEAHNSEIQAYFRGRDNLLCLNFEQDPGWGPLCEFLGCPVPEEPFPHENRQSY